jgi:hypothetical protein
MKRNDIPFGFLFWLFAGFIIFCGTTHILAMLTGHNPSDNFLTIVVIVKVSPLLFSINGKWVTGVISFITSMSLFFLIPSALVLPSPEMLRSEISQKLQAEKNLQNLYEKSLTVNEVASRIRSSLETGKVLQTTVEQLQKALDADKCLVLSHTLQYLAGTIPGTDYLV